MKCLDEHMIQRLVDGSASDSEEAGWLLHVSSCDTCGEKLESHRDNQQLFNDLRDARQVAKPVASSAPAAPEGYEIIGELARGGQGTVYRAFQHSTQREVALKVLLQGAHATAKERTRFEREIEIAAGLHHANIVQVYDSGDSNGALYYVMELVEGRPLDGLLESADSDMGPEVSLALFLKVCDAVAYAHQRGVIHRDLKPGNILITPDSNPRILDFGLARTVDTERHRVTSAGDFLGTLAYASPEQVTRGGDAVDIRSDVYSLGVILYELLTGRMPYDVSSTVLQTIRSIEDEVPAPPSLLRPGLSKDVDIVVLKALSKDPERRYQSARDLQADIHCTLQGDPISARRDSTLYLLRMTLRKHRLVCASAAIVFVSLLVALGVSLKFWSDAVRDRDLAGKAEIAATNAKSSEEEQRKKADRQRDAARYEAYIANIAAGAGALDRHDVVEAAVRLGATTEQLRGWEHSHFVSELDLSRSQHSFRGDDNFWRCTINDACTHAALIRYDESVLIVDCNSGEKVSAPPAKLVQAVAFHPSRPLLAMGNTAGRIFVWDYASQQEIVTFAGPAEMARAVCFSGDGKRLAVCANDPAGTRAGVAIHDLATAELICSKDQTKWFSEGIDLNHNGTRLAIAHFSGVAMLSDDGEVQEDLPELSGAAGCVRFSPDGKRLAVGARNGDASLWDSASGRVTRLTGHSASVDHIGFDPTGEFVVTGSRDKTIRIWDTTGESVGVRCGHYGRILAVSMTDTQLASIAGDRTVRTWDGPNRLRDDLLTGHTGKVADVAFDPRGRRLASASWDQTVRVFDLRRGTSHEFTGHTGPVQSVAFSPNGRLLASCSWDGSICLWDVRKRELVGRMLGHAEGARVHDACFIEDGAFLVSGSSDDTLRIWDLSTLSCVATLTGHDDHIHAVALSPDGSLIASAGHYSVRVWDVKSRKLVAKFDRTIVGDDFSLAFDPTSKRVAAGNGRVISVWDISSRTQLTDLDGHHDEIHSVVFSKDGSRLFSAAFDNRVLVWDTATNRSVAELRNYPSHPNSITLDQNNRVMAAGLDNGMIKLWYTYPRPRMR